jgi:hypothetical protein
MKYIDLTGQKFGRLSVVGYEKSDNRGNSLWKCVCECGQEKTIIGYNLKNMLSKSCGCLAKENISEIRITKHGKSKSKEFNIWNKMIQRCTNPNNPSYKDYGGRGIVVCDRWMEFIVFMEDMGDRPSATHSLDREDNERGYSPDNCRWATKKEQSNNRRNNRFITAFGETKTIANWVRDKRCLISHQLLTFRIVKRGWEPEKAITQKSKRSAH